jgi:uncharacterized protein GlcG (DUF336 family)
MMTLAEAQSILAGTLKRAREMSLKPLAVAILDERGTLKCYAAEDGTSLLRFQIAHGKAYGALGMGFGSRELLRRTEKQPAFINAVNAAAGGALIPVPGGVLVRSRNGDLLGAVGVSGDTSDNDESAAVAGIDAAGLVADPG